MPSKGVQEFQDAIDAGLMKPSGVTAEQAAGVAKTQATDAAVTALRERFEASQAP